MSVFIKVINALNEFVLKIPYVFRNYTHFAFTVGPLGYEHSLIANI